MILNDSRTSTAILWIASLAACSRAADEAPPRPPVIPRIDVHTHVDPAAFQRALRLLDRGHIAVAVNVSGGMPGLGLEEALAAERASGGRFRVFCNLDFRDVDDPGWVARSREILRRCRQAGALGWKIPKALGLGYRTSEGLLAVDDPRLDPVFEEAGRLGLVVLIHVADPRAFFEPRTPANERWEELEAHPEWSFEDPAFPRWEELLEALDRRIGRHPSTRFIGAHFGNAAEEPERVARMLARHPNYFIDTAARIPEIGRHPAAEMRRFFTRWQDRILFGTDLGVGRRSIMLGSTDGKPVTEASIALFFGATDRWFETRDRGMAHPTPIQGRWTIDGLGLDRAILEKVYHANATRLLGIQLPRVGSVDAPPKTSRTSGH